MITILYDTLIIRLIKQQSIWQKHFCSKICVPHQAVNDSKFQVHCLLLGAGGDGREREMLLVTRHKCNTKNLPIQ